jgi:hypothetical protein
MGNSDSEGDEDDVRLTLLPRSEYPTSEDDDAADLAKQNSYFTALLSIFWIMLLVLFALVTEYDPSVRSPKSQMDSMYIYYHQVRVDDCKNTLSPWQNTALHRYRTTFLINVVCTVQLVSYQEERAL